MAGLLKPQAATMLIGALRREFPSLPIHVHTHDTAGTGVASMLACADAGADAVDGAIDSMSGMTSQPSLGAMVAALKDGPLATGLEMKDLSTLIEYWESVRFSYSAFESGQKSGSAEVYTHEMPGGQYTNLQFQSTSLGLAEEWPEVRAACPIRCLLSHPPPCPALPPFVSRRFRHPPSLPRPSTAGKTFVRGGQPATRRHRQGHSLVQGRWRPRPVHGDQ